MVDGADVWVMTNPAVDKVFFPMKAHSFNPDRVSRFLRSLRNLSSSMCPYFREGLGGGVLLHLLRPDGLVAT